MMFPWAHLALLRLLIDRTVNPRPLNGLLATGVEEKLAEWQVCHVKRVALCVEREAKAGGVH